jgi:hypothetical protein
MKTKTIIFLSNRTASKHNDTLVPNRLGAETSYKQGTETSYKWDAETSGDETSLLVLKRLSAWKSWCLTVLMPKYLGTEMSSSPGSETSWCRNVLHPTRDAYSSMTPDITFDVFRGPYTSIFLFVFPIELMRLITVRYFCHFTRD